MSDIAPSDPDITLTLPLSSWSVVMAHLGRGQFCDVVELIKTICEQADPQIEAAKAAPPKTARSDEPEQLESRNLQ